MSSRIVSLSAAAAAAALGCRTDGAPSRQEPVAVEPAADPYAAARDQLIAFLGRRGISDARVLEAMRRVPRHELVPPELRGAAYEDRAMQIGFEQTISQPFVVASMTAAAQLGPGKRVLEVGTGSGYQAAVLAELGAEVYTIEIVEPLAKRARADLERLGYHRIQFRIGDGYRGWPEAAPFDAIVVTAAPPEVPRPLVDQLAVGGRLVIPVGEDDQKLQVITRRADGTSTETLYDVRFVPMTGEAQRARDAR